MSDCEDFFSDWISPGKRKRKKNLGEKTCVKYRHNVTVKTDEKIQKKKKKKRKTHSKFKEALGERKEKKKEKKKKKSLVKLNDSSHAAKSKASDPHSTDHLTQDSKKKTKRKKKVAFDLSPDYICVKRPKLVSSSLKENILPEKETVTDNSCQVTKTQPSQAQSHDIDSQCTSDDINSQDLFITQKTFRTFFSESSSGEASDKVVDTPSPQTMTQQEVVQNAPGIKIKCAGGSNPHLHPKKVDQSLFKKKAALILEEEGDVEQNLKKPMKVNTNLIGEKIHGVKSNTVNQYLASPVVVSHSLDGKKSSTLSQQCPSCHPNTNHKPFLPLQTSTASIATQTENFFSAEFSSYLSLSNKGFYLETLQPLDLSLPQRARKDLERGFSEKSEVKVDKAKLSDQKASSVTREMKKSSHRDPSLHPDSFSEKEAKEFKMKEPAVRQLWCESTKHKGRIAPSPQSESEPKSADTTSSEDNESACRTGKVDRTQVRAVQMRLNESFFFKTKGDGQSPRAESPLMKLVQSREVKNRKFH